MLVQIQILPLALATRMLDAAQAKAQQLGIRIVVAIIDNHGNLKAFARMDGSASGSVQIAQLKANSSASLPLSTRTLAERNGGQPGGPYAGGAIPGVVLLPGGLPIHSKAGEHLGGIGISGATPDLDEQCAQAALDAVADDL